MCCNFFSAIASRTGKVYHLGENIRHEDVIEKFKLKDKDGHICRVEITPKKDLDYLQPVNEKYWEFQIDEDEPAWWEQKHEDRCWKAFSDWMKSNKGKRFRRKFKKLMVWADRMKSKSGEQHIHATKLTKGTQELIEAYYKKSGSVRDSVRDSVLYSLGTFLGNKDAIKLKLPADIFKAGVVHAKINDEIWVWGRKGKLLKKWKVKK